MKIEYPALVIIFLFTFLPLWIGELSRKVSLPNVEDFFVHSRKMPSITVFFTVYATWWSSFAFLGSSSYFFSKGPVYFTGIAWNILFGVLFLVIGKRIWFYGKVNKYITPTDFFADIYQSRTLNNIITLIMILFTVPYLQIQLSGGAYLIEIASQGVIPWRISGLIFYLIIIIYLWAGGLRAVAWADIFYGILIFSGMIIGGIYLSARAGGIDFLFREINRSNPDYLLLPGPSGDSGVLLWLSMFLMTPIGALMGPQLWIRVYSVEKQKTFNLMPFLISFASIAYLGSVLAGYSGILLVPNLTKPDAVLPMMLIQYTPIWLGAFLFCCGAAAALSTANSQIHAMSAVYAIDIHRRYINSNISDRSAVHIARWAILLISTAAYIVLVQSPALLVHTGLIAMSGTAQVFVPAVGAMFWKKSHPLGAIGGLLSGIIVLVCATFLLKMNASYAGALGIIANTLVFSIVSSIATEDSNVQDRITSLKQSYEKNYL